MPGPLGGLDRPQRREQRFRRRLVGRSVVLASGSYPKVLPGIEVE